MKKEHVSASAIKTFECPVRFVNHYDDDRTVTTRNEYSDVGVLIHATLECYRDPAREHEYTFEVFEALFEEVCRTHVFAESLRVYKRAKEMLPSAFRLTEVHPTIPMHMAESIAVEQELLMPVGDGFQLWQMEGWPLPMKGSIDWVAIIESPKGDGHILFIEDTKTGRPRTHEELVGGDDPAPAIYALYARDVLVPWLATQGITIIKIVLGWTYVGEGTAVPMYETDFDHDVTRDYVANISSQMIEFEKRYNAFLERLMEKFPEGLDHGMNRGLYEIALNEWFAQYEKPNSLCSYCPRANVCITFNRMLQYNSAISLVGEIDFVALEEEYKNYQTINSTVEKRLDKIKETIKLYIEQEGVRGIPIGDTGRYFTANPQSRDRYSPAELAPVLSYEWLLRHANITKKDLEAERMRIAHEEPDRLSEFDGALAAATTTVPYSRPVKITKNIKE